MSDPEARTWRRWFTFSVAQFVVAGYFLMAYGIGRIVRATNTLDASVKQQAANAEIASLRLEAQTQTLVKWTKALAGVTVLLFLATVVILVVTIWPLLASSPIISMLSAAASSVRVSDGDQVWLWIERGSAVITILGLAALFLQLRQMTRRPKLRLGFHVDPGGTGRRVMKIVDTIEIPVHWNPGDDLSQPIKLWVLVVNDMKASGTASDINAEARYPKWLVPEGDGDLKVPPGIDVWQLSKEHVTLNPGLTFWLRGTFRVPRGRTQVQILVVASMRDAGPIDKMLTVSLRET